jgi:hypothetical protein
MKKYFMIYSIIFICITIPLKSKAQGIYSQLGCSTDNCNYILANSNHDTLFYCSGSGKIGLGKSTKAYGDLSIAIGFESRAIGIFSATLGRGVLASGDSSTAIGTHATASGGTSTAMGDFTTASGNSSTAMGDHTTASGAYSTAMGDRTTASGFASTAMGHYALASNMYSSAIGKSAAAIGDFSTAIGDSVVAFGTESLAMGHLTLAQGMNSIAIGFNSTANGDNSNAMGTNTTAEGNYSTTLGFNTNTNSSYSLAIGRYNDDNGSPTDWNPDDDIFTIGDGTSYFDRSNLLSVKKNGDLWIQGSFAETSDIRLKSDIARLEGTIDKIRQLNGINFYWKDKETMGNEKHIGLIAQDVEKVFPELVGENEGYKTTNYIGLIPVLIEALKEQQLMIDELQSQLEQMQH